MCNVSHSDGNFSAMSGLRQKVLWLTAENGASSENILWLFVARSGTL
jgi:hypothetical protein